MGVDREDAAGQAKAAGADAPLARFRVPANTAGVRCVAPARSDGSPMGLLQLQASGLPADALRAARMDSGG